MPRLPIVFIPGFIATELLSGNRVVFPPTQGTLSDPDRKARFIDLVCDLDELETGEPVRDIFFGLSKQAQSLYDLLRDYGYTTSDRRQFAAVGWDWRRAIDDPTTFTALRDAFLRLTAGSRVIVVVHSTGGLVLRRFLEAEPQWAASIDQIVAFGVPWGGTLKALRYLDGEKFGILRASLSARETRRVMSCSQAAFDLLPPPPAPGPGVSPPSLAFQSNRRISPMVTIDWIRQADRARMEPLATNAKRLMRSRAFPIAGARITNIAGFGATTENRADIAGPGRINFKYSDEGDGTVPLVSAEWIDGANVRTFHVPIGVYPVDQVPDYHSQLWNNRPLLEIYDQIFHDKPAEPFAAACLDSDDAAARGRDGLRVRISAAAGDGQALPNARVRFEDLRGTQPVAPMHDTRLTVRIPPSRLPTGEGAFGRFRAVVEWGPSSGRESRELVLIYRR